MILALDTPLRSTVYWLLNLAGAWLGSPGNDSPVLRVVVAEKDTGRIVWTNHGYTPSQDPEGAYHTLCEEIDYFTLDGFLRRRSPGYWRGGRPWRLP